MATKKTTKSDKSKKATKVQAAPPVEMANVAAATPAPAKSKAKKAKEPKAKKTSALDAAVRVLEEAGQPMNCQEMIDQMAARATGPAQRARPLPPRFIQQYCGR